MSRQLLESIDAFLQGEIPVDEFVVAYMDGWRKERDSGELLRDDQVTSEKLSSVFCLLDLYNQDDDRADYEFDEVRLRHETQKVFDGC